MVIRNMSMNGIAARPSSIGTRSSQGIHLNFEMRQSGLKIKMLKNKMISRIFEKFFRSVVVMHNTLSIFDVRRLINIQASIVIFGNSQKQWNSHEDD